MKKVLSLIIVVCILATTSTLILAEEYELQLSAVCEGVKEVGDQFLVTFELTDVKPYLTFQMNGAFDSSLAEIVAPVYTTKNLGVIENSFDNEEGTFNLVAYDQRISGIEEKVVCGILFEAKAEGVFKLSFTDKTMIGKAEENGFYPLDRNGCEVEIVGDTDGENVMIIEDAKPLTPFDDMLEYDWAEKAVGVMYKLGVLEGIADKSYEPGKNITRGDFLTMLVRICKLKSSANPEDFNDVDKDNYQYDYIRIAKALGIAKGDGENNFRPDEAVTRQDVCTLVYRTMLKMNKVNPKINADEYLGEYSDKDEIYPYATEAVAGLIRAKLFVGDENGLLRPMDNMTRAEAAVLLNALAEYNILISR